MKPRTSGKFNLDRTTRLGNAIKFRYVTKRNVAPELRMETESYDIPLMRGIKFTKLNPLWKVLVP